MEENTLLQCLNPDSKGEEPLFILCSKAVVKDEVLHFMLRCGKTLKLICVTRKMMGGMNSSSFVGQGRNWTALAPALSLFPG